MQAQIKSSLNTREEIMGFQVAILLLRSAQIIVFYFEHFEG